MSKQILCYISFRSLATQLLATSVALLTGACSTDIIGSDRVMSDDVHQAYEIGFREQYKSTTISATFRLGGPTGTTIEFKEPSQLTVNGILAKNTQFLGSHYRVEFPNQLVPEITTIWTSKEGTPYTNHFQIKPVKYGDPVPTRISKNGFTEIPVIAADLGAREKLEITLEQSLSSGGTNYATAATYEPSTGLLRIMPQDLETLRSGPATMKLRRASEISLTEKTMKGGTGAVTYETVPVSVVID